MQTKKKVVRMPTRGDRPRVGLKIVPQIEFDHYARMEPGQYPAFCQGVGIYRDNGFQRWVCAVRFDVLDESRTRVIGRLVWFLNLANNSRPKANRRTNYWRAWCRANGGPPKRGDRMTERIFAGRQAIIRIRDTKRNFIGEPAGDCSYSVVDEVVEWTTG